MLASRVFILSIGVTLCLSNYALGQGSYPAKTIHIFTHPAGGGGDIVARLIAQGMSANMGQPVIVENRPDLILGPLMARALPDGYSVLVSGQFLWIDPLLRNKPAWDPVKDFEPVTVAVSGPLVVLVNSQVSANSIRDLIALAKANPGGLNYGSANLGASSHLGPELLNAMAAVNIRRIPYKGNALALGALMANEVQVMITGASSGLPLVKSGKVKALAVTSAKPTALAPDLPTVSASGLPGYEMASMNTVFVPAKTPTAIINRLNQEIIRVLNQPATTQKLFGLGLEVVGSSPQEFAAVIRAETAKFGKIIKDSGIRNEDEAVR